MPEEVLIENGTPVYSLPKTIAKIKAQQALDKAQSTSGIELMIDQEAPAENFENTQDEPPAIE